MTEDLTIAAERPRAEILPYLRGSFRQLILWGLRAIGASAFFALVVGYLVPVARVSTGGLTFRMATLGALVRTLELYLGLFLIVPLVAALLLRRRYLAVGLFGLIVWTTLPTVWCYRPRAVPDVSGEMVTVMTCNLLRPNHRIDEVAAEIIETDPDIICFQEYATHWHDGLRERLAKSYPHRRHIRRKYDMGLAIYSKRPFIGDVEAFDFDHDPPAPPMRAVIEIDGEPVALYNLHMYQPWPASTMLRRRAQFAGFRDRLERETLPVIVAGDFNATPTSPMLIALAGMNYADAYDVGGWGLGATWPDAPLVRHLPGIRIDHVYLGEELTCTSAAVGEGNGSDHRPVTARIGFKQTR